jgi:uncharacterized membrane protein YuzA (DUF378 family)
MQEFIVYMIVGVAAATVVVAVIKRFMSKKGNNCISCEGCALKNNCSQKAK